MAMRFRMGKILDSEKNKTTEETGRKNKKGKLAMRESGGSGGARTRNLCRDRAAL